MAVFFSILLCSSTFFTLSKYVHKLWLQYAPYKNLLKDAFEVYLGILAFAVGILNSVGISRVMKVVRAPLGNHSDSDPLVAQGRATKVLAQTR